MARVVIIGDVGGHPDQLRWALASIGADADHARLPAGVTVVQVGDLIDRGPDSSGVLDLVQRFTGNHADRWIQLAGNHEAQYVPGGLIFWPHRLREPEAALLHDWWATGRMRVAAALRTADGEEYLLTHAGLTVQSWHELGDPMTAMGAAHLLNDRPEPLLWRTGRGEFESTAGPLWAAAGWQLYEPWLRYYAEGGFVPFGQIHGHSAPVDFAAQTWQCNGRVRQRACVDWAARQVRVRVGGRTFIGVDPRHGAGGAPQWQPLVLADATVDGVIG